VGSNPVIQIFVNESISAAAVRMERISSREKEIQSDFNASSICLMQLYNVVSQASNH
jgi:hypothetical protein